MASYEIEISRTAERQLKKLVGEEQPRVVRALLALADQPRPRGSRKLTGYDDVFRIRVGRFRVLYSVSDTRLVIFILKIGHRKDIYR
jgi:mRNA interferase RelE/StbE